MSDLFESEADNKVKKVEDYLNEADYSDEDFYVPSNFALEFVAFIKLVNGEEGEENLTPVLHYRMLDKVDGQGHDIINMLFRGAAKTTLLGEYLFLYIAVYGGLPDFGKVPLALYVSDSIENGVKNMRKNLEYRWENSDFLQHYIPETRFTDIRWEFKNKDGNTFICKGYGAKAISVDSLLLTENGFITMKDCQIGDRIFGPDGQLALITEKSEVFHKPMYQIELEDGRMLKVSEDHINSIVHKINANNNAEYVKKDLLTTELLELPLQHIRLRKRKNKPNYLSRENLLFIENTAPLDYHEKVVPLDPYTLGLMLGDGSIKENGSNVLHGAADDINFYKQHIPYKFGSEYVDKRNNNVVSLSLLGLSQKMRDLGIVGHGDTKHIPFAYLTGSIHQRTELLQGLLDTDGSIQENGRMDFCSNSEQLVDDVAFLLRSLGGTAKKRKIGKAYRIEIWIEFNPFKLPRKAARFTKRTKPLVAIKAITPIADEPSQCISIDNEDRQYLANDHFRTHNTGVRGAKEMGTRPVLAVLDDLISDEDARSPTVIASVEDTVYKAVNYALHPKNYKKIWSGTPFNAKDPLYKAVESGAWEVNVYPVCEHFPCTREEFRGAWEDRFTYDYVKKQHSDALKLGKIDTFNQELMLRIMSDEDRLVHDSDICWYQRTTVLQNKGAFNFYITTDFATSEKETADFSVISVWAINHNRDWFWVDGTVKRQLMDQNINHLFNYAQLYKPQSVGIEISGQQKGFISWIQNEMIKRNVYFSLASENNNNNPGIRPTTNKLQRFNVVLPLFKARKIYFPQELKESPEIIEFMDELTLASLSGFKSKHDDCIDTVSMLPLLNAWPPSENDVVMKKNDKGIWAEDDEWDNEPDGLDSYIV